MSGRDLVDELRSGAKPLPREPRHGGVFDLVIVAVAVIAIGSLAFVGFNTLFGGRGAPQPPAPADVAQAAPAAGPGVALVEWTEADTKSCTNRGQTAANSAGINDVTVTNRSISEGVTYLTTSVECQLTKKVTRFCGTAGNARLVALINDYLTRMDLVKLGIGAQGAPMALVGGMMGGEASAGSGLYDDLAKQTFDFMSLQDGKVVKAIRTLARGGVVKPEDFKAFGVGGVPEHIAKIFAGAEAKSNICA